MDKKTKKENLKWLTSLEEGSKGIHGPKEEQYLFLLKDWRRKSRKIKEGEEGGGKRRRNEKA